MAVLHTDAYGASRHVGRAINLGGVVTMLTTTNISAATNLATIQAAVDAVVVHADQIPIRARLKRALALGYSIGDINDTNLGTATTYASLAALTQALVGKAMLPD